MKRNTSVINFFSMALLIACLSPKAQLGKSSTVLVTREPFIVISQAKNTVDDHNIFEKYDVSKTGKARKQRLDAFANYLKENRHFQGYIMSYGGRRSCVGEALNRGEKAKRYLMNSKGIKDHRITVIDAGYRDNWVVELWYGAAGGARPSPIEIIDPKQVIIERCGRKSP